MAVTSPPRRYKIAKIEESSDLSELRKIAKISLMDHLHAVRATQLPSDSEPAAQTVFALLSRRHVGQPLKVELYEFAGMPEIRASSFSSAAKNLGFVELETPPDDGIKVRKGGNSTEVLNVSVRPLDLGRKMEIFAKPLKLILRPEEQIVDIIASSQEFVYETGKPSITFSEKKRS